MKLIKQHDERDCGAACLSMIASYHGLRYPISKYRELTKTDQNGASIYGLCDAAQKIGFQADALSGTMEELLEGVSDGEIKFPFIAHIITEDYMQHFVVVLNIKKNEFVVADPAKGKVRYTIEQFAKLWDGYIVTFEKTASFQPGNFAGGSFKRFFYLLRGQYAKLISIIFMSLAISLIGIIGSFVFKIVIDDFYSTENSFGYMDKVTGFITGNAFDLNLFFICLLGLYILQAIIQFLRGYLISLTSKKIDLRLMIPYYDHIMELPISAANTRKTGEYISRFSDAEAIREAVSNTVLTLVLDSFMVVACGIVLFLENVTLFCISLTVIFVYAIIVFCYKKPIENINREVMENNARVQSYLKESIDGIETVKANRTESMVKRKNSFNFNRFINSIFNNSVISVSQDSLCGLVQLMGIVIILWAGTNMVSNNQISLGSLITFYALLAYFIEPIKNLIGLQPMIQTAVIAAERLNDVLDIPVEDKESGKNDEMLFNKITFADVNFHYGNNEAVLKNVSFEIERGEKVAIVGESGCGKTTLAKLLLKFYTIDSGEILIDGDDLVLISANKIRDSISYIDQNTFLFSDTVKNNLVLGNEEIDDQQIINACKIVKADEFIQELPFGYNTFIDENGKNLSGGQRQRLAIARALLRKPKVIIFDEATSNLDTVTESVIKDTIFNLNKEVTCIIIAHRLSTIKNCDKIIVMGKGEILEVGKHQELMNKRGKYFELYNKQ